MVDKTISVPGDSCLVSSMALFIFPMVSIPWVRSFVPECIIMHEGRFLTTGFIWSTMSLVVAPECALTFTLLSFAFLPPPVH